MFIRRSFKCRAYFVVCILLSIYIYCLLNLIQKHNTHTSLEKPSKRIKFIKQLSSLKNFNHVESFYCPGLGMAAAQLWDKTIPRSWTTHMREGNVLSNMHSKKVQILLANDNCEHETFKGVVLYFAAKNVPYHKLQLCRPHIIIISRRNYCKTRHHVMLKIDHAAEFISVDKVLKKRIIKSSKILQNLK